MTKARDCGDKVPYTSRAHAENRIWILVRTQGARRARWQAYQCKHCGAWHIGHKRKRDSQK